MWLTPLDIQHQKFGVTFRGYNMQDVDDFLERVLHDYEEILQENSSLKEKMQDLRDQLLHYQQMEQSIKDAILAAQKTAEDHLQNKKKEADLCLQEAHLQAQRLLEEARTNLRALEMQISEAKAQKDRILTSLRTLLRTELALLEEET